MKDLDRIEECISALQAGLHPASLSNDNVFDKIGLALMGLEELRNEVRYMRRKERDGK